MTVKSPSSSLIVMPFLMSDVEIAGMFVATFRDSCVAQSRQRSRDVEKVARPFVSARTGVMKLLLTSAGVKNPSIHDALVDLLGKPIATSSALCIPTASYAAGGFDSAWRFISGRAATPMCELGWQSLGVLELTALPSIDDGDWVPKVEAADT